jgi:Zinc carboxypeptidase
MLLTRAEATGYEETSLHAHVMAFIEGLEERRDPRLFVSRFGTSVQGRALPLLVLSSRGIRTPEESRAYGLPVVLILNGIHAGEVEGKEASLMLVRDLLAGRHGQLLEHMTVVVVPLFNPDGNDAVDPGNRALHLPKLEGQIGPRLVGTRVNAQGVNLNRDYINHAAPEMRLLQTRVWHRWNPDLSIDNHATNGSIHRFSMTYDVPHTEQSGRAEPIAYMRETLLPAVTRALHRNHAIDAGWYGNFVEDERTLDAQGEADPKAPVREGWMTYPHHPRFGANYRGLTSRMDLLLECYSYIPFAERVRTAYAFMLETLTHVAHHVDDVRAVNAVAERPRDLIAVGYRLDVADEPVEILTRSPRTLDGTPTSVRLPHFARFVGTRTVTRPDGYVVPADLIPFFRGHGLRVEPAPAAAEVEVATLAARTAEGGRKILEANETGQLHVAWKRGTRALPPGAAIVRSDDRLAAVAAYLCEPESDDSVYQNGLSGVPELGAELPIWRLPR